MIMQRVVMLSYVMLNVIMLIDVMMNVVAPLGKKDLSDSDHHLFCRRHLQKMPKPG